MVIIFSRAKYNHEILLKIKNLPDYLDLLLSEFHRANKKFQKFIILSFFFFLFVLHYKNTQPSIVFIFLLNKTHTNSKYK